MRPPESTLMRHAHDKEYYSKFGATLSVKRLSVFHRPSVVRCGFCAWALSAPTWLRPVAFSATLRPQRSLSVFYRYRDARLALIVASALAGFRPHSLRLRLRSFASSANAPSAAQFERILQARYARILISHYARYARFLHHGSARFARFAMIKKLKKA